MVATFNVGLPEWLHQLTSKNKGQDASPLVSHQPNLLRTLNIYVNTVVEVQRGLNIDDAYPIHFSTVLD